MNFFKKITLFFVTLLCSITYAQFKVGAELRPRTEYRHGYKQIFSKDASPALFTNQRTRLKLGYSSDNFKVYVSLQNYRVWGDVPQLNKNDKNGNTIHQAFAEINLSPFWSVKLGRQEIFYDDHRIFGNVGWAQQARSHDVALLRFKNKNTKLDLGFAFNQFQESLEGRDLLAQNTYKAMQYAWFHKQWNGFSGSFLFLNNGMKTSKVLKYSQTVGTHLKLITLI